jgi:hypothetical protein
MGQSIFQWIIGELGDILIWIRDNIHDDAVRREVLIDLGLDPDLQSNAPLPQGSNDNIELYRNAVNPDKEALNQALLDIRILVGSFKDFLVPFVQDPRNTKNIDQLVWMLFQLLGTNYVRLHLPRYYWLFQVLGFLGEITDVYAIGRSTTAFVLENLWDFITHPINYIRNLFDNIVKALTYSGRLPGPSLETATDAQAFSYIFLPLAGLMAFDEYKSDGKGKQNRYLYSWETAPAGLEGETQEDIDRAERERWANRISESAFSFDFQLSEGANTEYLGGTVMVISKEDVPAELQPEEGVEIEPSGGLFVSLNGEVNTKILVDENWEVETKINSGNFLDFFIGRLSGLDKGGDGTASIGVIRRKDPETGASFALPNPTGSRLTIGNIFFNAYYGIHDHGIEIALQDNAVVISPEGVDGFLEEILPRQEAQLTYSIAVGYSKKKDFYIKHSIDLLSDLLEDADTPAPEDEDETPKPKSDSKKKSSIETMFPIHKEMGLIRFESIDWSYGGTKKKDAFGLNVSVRTTFSTKLGPLFLQVQKIGVGVDLSVPREGDDISQTALDFGFLFPKGVGLRVDSEVVSGGGFLEFDRENHRYAGVLTLNFQSIELSAVGLITTLLPNNQKGYSVLISISVLFKPALQLPFGFQLDGVGGLVGIHRTMKVDELRSRILKGSINSIMFPKDVIKDAPKIISDLRAIFPPQHKHYVLAPFLRVSWGTPSVVEIDLGVLVELPFKGRLLLVGSVGVFLPNKEAPERLADIHVDVLGDFNFSASYVLIEGRLRKSKIKDVPLEGGFAFMLSWGERTQFLMSLGGYHPRYQKPDGFPKIPRLTALIKKGNDTIITCQYYQAITSNSFQIGFKADLLIKWKSATVKGWLELNALLQFDPFLFEADLHIGAAIRYKSRNLAGVDFYILLSGPAPWRAKGYAKIEILFFSLKIKFNRTWGDEQTVAPATVSSGELFTRLKTQLEETRSWSGLLPEGFSNAASLRSLTTVEAPGLLLVHPSGTLEVRQTVLPLKKTIEKMGNSLVTEQPVYSVTGYEIGEGPNAIVAGDGQQTILKEHFSRGQFEDLEDAEKISTPDFELMQAGVRFDGVAASDFSEEMDFSSSDFEDIILRGEETEKPDNTSLNWQELNWIRPSLQRKGSDKNKPAEMFGLVDEMPPVEENKFKILSKDHLQEPVDLGEHAFATYSDAKEYMKSHLWTKRANWQIQEAR